MIDIVIHDSAGNKFPSSHDHISYKSPNDFIGEDMYELDMDYAPRVDVTEPLGSCSHKHVYQHEGKIHIESTEEL